MLRRCYGEISFGGLRMSVGTHKPDFVLTFFESIKWLFPLLYLGCISVYPSQSLLAGFVLLPGWVCWVLWPHKLQENWMQVDFVSKLVWPLTNITSYFYQLILGVGAVVYVSMAFSCWMGLLLAFLAVTNEMVDVSVQTSVCAEGESQLPQVLKRMNLQSRPLLYTALSMILMFSGALQNAVRGGALIYNLLRR